MLSFKVLTENEAGMTCREPSARCFAWLCMWASLIVSLFSLAQLGTGPMRATMQLLMQTHLSSLAFDKKQPHFSMSVPHVRWAEMRPWHVLVPEPIILQPCGPKPNGEPSRHIGGRFFSIFEYVLEIQTKQINGSKKQNKNGANVRKHLFIL